MTLPKAAVATLAACLALAGPATPTRAGLLSVTGDVIAIMAGELYVGTAEGHYDGSGTLAIRAQQRPTTTCSGEFTSSAELGGKGQLRCTDGAGASFRFDRLTILRGHGTGTFTRGPMSFTYGLSAEESRPYLLLPAGMRLGHDGTELVLVAY
ncbi:MAG TPA: hypothetical protein VET66_05500 [Steroidobacteraceae bacterium]|nr:hypothetical protein [Steroidobacteraceae bacterium]